MEILCHRQLKKKKTSAISNSKMNIKKATHSFLKSSTFFPQSK
uniref:Uncharacterized protein n=1 Tax=Rhizophora mucronata TaxID=61149 RepID=A0A2P2PZ09_RHIMU